MTREPLFAKPLFQRTAGLALRPGGVTLTVRALEYCDLPWEATVLDIGCGRGATARLIAARGHRVLAVDPSERMLSENKASGVLPVQARAEALPLPDGSVDAAFCECVLSVTGQPGKVLAEAARVLRPGGWLAMSDLYLRGGGQAHGAFGCLSGAASRDVLLADLRGAGFVVETFEDHSKLLAELAGRLIFSGMSASDLYGCNDGCAGDGAKAKHGYFLCMARTKAC